MRPLFTGCLAPLPGLPSLSTLLANDGGGKNPTSFQGETDRAENHGFSSTKLDALRDDLAANQNDDALARYVFTPLMQTRLAAERR